MYYHSRLLKITFSYRLELFVYYKVNLSQIETKRFGQSFQLRLKISLIDSACR